MLVMMTTMTTSFFLICIVHIATAASLPDAKAGPFVCQNNPIVEPVGVITSPNYPANYPDNAQCVYNIIASPGSIVELLINDIATEVCCDFLTIFDGPAITSRLLRRCSGSSCIGLSIFSSSNTMTLQFTSDKDTNYRGFNATHFTRYQTTTTGLPTTAPSPQPCKANFALLIDASNGLTPTEFARQQWFIATQMFHSYWSFSQWAVAQYDASFKLDFPFQSLRTQTDIQGAVQGTVQGNAKGSLTNALQHAVTDFAKANAQSGVQQKTVLFTSTSDPTDVANAMQAAKQVQALGVLIIVGMGPNVNMDLLATLASPYSALQWPDLTAFPNHLPSQILVSYNC